MKKLFLILVMCSSSLAAQVQLARDVQIGSGSGGTSGTATYVTADGTGSPPTNYQVLTAGSNISVTPNAGAHTITIGANSGVLAANTIFGFCCISILDDDNHTQNPNVNVSSWSTTSGTTTVTTATAHGLTTGNWVNTRFMTSWPGLSVSGIILGTGYTLFQVTVVDSTHFTINTSLITAGSCASTCGFEESAMNNLPYITTNAASFPSGANNNTYVYLIGSGTPTICGASTAYSTSPFHTLIAPTVTGQPGYLFLIDPWNDILGGSSAATIEACYNTLLPLAHADGWKIVMPLVWQRSVGLGGTSPTTSYQVEQQLDVWMRNHGKSTYNTTPSDPTYEQYWDVEPQAGYAYNDPTNPGQYYGASSAWQNYAADMSNAVLAGASAQLQQGPTAIWGQPYLGGTTTSVNNGYMYVPYADTQDTFQWVNAAQTKCVLCLNTATSSVSIGGTLGVTTTVSGSPTAKVSNLNGGGAVTQPDLAVTHSTPGSGNNIWANLGIDTSTSNASLKYGFHYDSTLPYGFAELQGETTENIRYYGSGETSFPNITTTPSTSPTCFNGTHGGLTNVGCSGGGTTTNALTMNNSGSGAASGTTFNGGSAVTLSYNTLGAGGLAATNTWSALNTYSAGLNLSGTTSPLQVGGSAGSTSQCLLSAGTGATPTWGTCPGGGGASPGASIFNITSATTNTGTSATSMLGTAQTIPAGNLITSTPININIGGIYSVPASYTGTVTVAAFVDGVQIATTGALSIPVTAVTNGSWTVQCQITTYTTGVSGTYAFGCPFLMLPSSTSTITTDGGSLAISGTTTIDTTASHTFDLKWTWSTATGSPTVTGQWGTALVGGAPVTSFSGDGALLTNSASTGGVTATLGTAAATKWWGNPTGSTATPGYNYLPISYGGTVNTGVAASPAFPNQIAPHTGSISTCKFLTQTSDGATALVFNIKENGTSILSGGTATIAAGTASQTVTTLTLTGTISVTQGQIWEYDITGGTSSWTGSFICY